jgi:hypothetical protein
MNAELQSPQGQPFMENVQQALSHYAQAYQQLYKKSPRDLRMLDNGWVSVNGARMRVTELEFLTQQLRIEYNQHATSRRSMVQKLIGWFSRQ